VCQFWTIRPLYGRTPSAPDRVEDLAQRVDAPLLQESQEANQDLGSGDRIAQGGMPRRHRHAETGGDGLERVRLARPVQAARQEPSVEDGAALQGRQAQAARLRLEKPQVEGDLVTYQDRVAGELQKGRQHRVHGRRVGHHGVGDAVELHALGRDGAAGSDERVEGLAVADL
jgi:hypothetical protein